MFFLFNTNKKSIDKVDMHGLKGRRKVGDL